MTEYVVYCPPHRDYLAHVSVGGTTWCRDQRDAKRYPSKPKARDAAKLATWRDHRPVVWAVPELRAELD